MKTILVWIDIPTSLPGQDHRAKTAWKELLASLKNTPNFASTATMLAENLWQIDARTNLPFLVELLHGVGKIPLPYAILPLEEGQDWISSNTAKILQQSS
jgi:hypothetical protein